MPDNTMDLKFDKIKRGDILMYWKHRGFGFAGTMIELGEKLEDGVQNHEYFHVAIAISSTELIEANGMKVAKGDINFNDGFDIYRVSLPKMEDGLKAIESLEGELYDWFLIIDDSLRYLTEDKVHLPDGFIDFTERHSKICSTVGKIYLDGAGFDKPIKKNPSPEDIYIAIKEYMVVM